MLRACRRLLRPGGRIAFYTIFLTPGLSAGDRRRALKAAPPAVYSSAEQPALLRSAGFRRIEQTDLTPEFLRVARAWRAARERHADALIAATSEEDFRAGQAERTEYIGVIEAGLLRRALFVAER